MASFHWIRLSTPSTVRLAGCPSPTWQDPGPTPEAHSIDPESPLCHLKGEAKNKAVTLLSEAAEVLPEFLVDCIDQIATRKSTSCSAMSTQCLLVDSLLHAFFGEISSFVWSCVFFCLFVC